MYAGKITYSQLEIVHNHIFSWKLHPFCTNNENKKLKMRMPVHVILGIHTQEQSFNDRLQLNHRLQHYVNFVLIKNHCWYATTVLTEMKYSCFWCRPFIYIETHSVLNRRRLIYL